MASRIDNRDIFTEVEEANKSGRLWASGRDLIIELGTMKPADPKKIEPLVEGQVTLARERKNISFMKDIRKFGELICSDAFMLRVVKAPVKTRRPGMTLARTPGRGSRTVSRVQEAQRRPNLLSRRDFPALPGIKEEPEEIERVKEPAEPRVVKVKQEVHEAEIIEISDEETTSPMEIEGEEESGLHRSQPANREEVEGEEEIELHRSQPVNREEVEGEEESGSHRSRPDHREEGYESRYRSRSPLSRRLSGVSGREESRGDESQQERDRVRRQVARGRQVCPLPGCRARRRNLHRHAEAVHIPKLFHRSSLLDEPQLDGERLQALLYILRLLRVNTVNAGMEFVHRRKLQIPDNAVVHDLDRPWIERVGRKFFWFIPRMLRLPRVNSRVLLFHWRVQLALLVLLRPRDQKQYLEGFGQRG